MTWGQKLVPPSILRIFGRETWILRIFFVAPAFLCILEISKCSLRYFTNSQLQRNQFGVCGFWRPPWLHDFANMTQVPRKSKKTINRPYIHLQKKNKNTGCNCGKRDVFFERDPLKIYLLSWVAFLAFWVDPAYTSMGQAQCPGNSSSVAWGELAVT